MYSYTAYGLGVVSEFRLPELRPGNGTRDVEIRRGQLDMSARERFSHVNPEHASLYWPEVGAFRIVDGKTITVDPAFGADEEGVRLLLLGSVLGVLLHQRGQLLLHGSAVEIDGGVVVFLGHSGWGKSTTAAAFQSRGYRILTDDIAAVDNSGAQVFPGYPQIKLRSDSALALGHDSEQLARLHHRVEKRALRCPEAFSLTPLPLRRLYVLAEGSQPAVEELSSGQALIELVRHSYAAGILKSTGCEPEHMIRCADLARRFGVRRLQKGRSLKNIPQLIDTVLADIAAD